MGGEVRGEDGPAHHPGGAGRPECRGQTREGEIRQQSVQRAGPVLQPHRRAMIQPFLFDIYGIMGKDVNLTSEISYQGVFTYGVRFISLFFFTLLFFVSEFIFQFSMNRRPLFLRHM